MNVFTSNQSNGKNNLEGAGYTENFIRNPAEKCPLEDQEADNRKILKYTLKKYFKQSWPLSAV